MNVRLVEKKCDALKADVLVTLLTKALLKNDANVKVYERAGFSAEQENLCFLHEKGILAVGLDDTSADNIRSACVAVIKALKASNYKSAKVVLESQESIAAVVEGVVLGGYEFNDYKSEPKKPTFKEFSLCLESENAKEAQKIFDDAMIIATATCYTRDIVNTAPQELNPKTLAKLAKKLAKDNELECTILDEEGLAKENMRSMLAVGRASVHESHLIHLVYKPKKAKKVITLVGKGLTYDSGGLSLKAATSMVTMKMDKAGACAVLGMLKAASELKLDLEIHGFIGAVENMVGGNAYKPDDVLVSRSSTTIEVRNTDAEGRLVLCDVLDYAQEKVDADYIFDFATLTGACMVALGPYTTGIMGHSNMLKHGFFDAARESGELVGTLPFNKHLKKLLKSEIADISNVSSKPYGGAITAGLFLDKFIKEKNKDKWLHFDIAGSAYTESPWDCNPYGATGAGVRMLSRFFQSIN